MKTFFQIVFLSGAAVLSIGGASKAEPMEEYRVKALFLYNFTQFIEWPAETFKDASDPLTICVLAPNPFERGELEQAFRGKRIDNHPLTTRIINDPNQSPGCQIVFISVAAVKHARALIGEHKRAGLLTVGENPGFAAGGGAVNFLVKDGRVRLEINVAAAEREGLRISAKLLKLAEIVTAGGKQ